MSNQLSILDLPPSVKGSKTSYLAAEKIKRSVNTLRLKVFHYIVMNGPVTDEEIQEGLELGGNCERPRRRELQLRGMIEDSGEQGITKSGRKAVRWRVK